MKTLAGLLLLYVGCAAPSTDPVIVDPDEAAPGNGSNGTPTGGTPIPDVRCGDLPDAGPAGAFRHWTSSGIAWLGDPRHRGIDLIEAASVATQQLRGAISYTIADKALEDEQVELFACRAGAWVKLGAALTDAEGMFTLDLADADRLPVGMRDMFVSVVGDRTGARFLAYVAPDHTRMIASDVDGTLTASENAFLQANVVGGAVNAQPGAAGAFDAATSRDYQLVYVTARGQQYMGDTRSWLADHAFPRGPLRLSPSFITLPGGDTVDFKTTALASLQGLDLVAGVGNRASDITAYTNAGLAPGRIFISLPEYVAEVQPALDAGAATGFSSYDDLRAVFAQLPQ